MPPTEKSYVGSVPVSESSAEGCKPSTPQIALAPPMESPVPMADEAEPPPPLIPVSPTLASTLMPDAAERCEPSPEPIAPTPPAKTPIPRRDLWGPLVGCKPTSQPEIVSPCGSLESPGVRLYLADENSQRKTNAPDNHRTGCLEVGVQADLDIVPLLRVNRRLWVNRPSRRRLRIVPERRCDGQQRDFSTSK